MKRRSSVLLKSSTRYTLKIQRQTTSTSKDCKITLTSFLNEEICDQGYRSIKSVDELLPIIAKFKNLMELNLSNNKITVLPAEGLEALESLYALNLAGNDFDDVKR